jgi:multimeric flavodoxin WrbA
MKTKVNLLAIIGSQREKGNSYYLAKAVLESLPVNYKTIQLAEKNIGFCTLCEQCKDGSDCILEDDFNEILKEMQSADGLVFSLPKYLFVGSKFLAFLERLDTLVHMRRHGGYEHKTEKTKSELFSTKPFCIFFTSGTGHVENEILRITEEYIEALGLKPVFSDETPHLGVNVKAGDAKGEVLHNKEAMEECGRFVARMINLIRPAHQVKPKNPHVKKLSAK